jgi:hypothetical protein
MTKNIFFTITIFAISLLFASGCEESSLSPSSEPAALQSAPAKAPVVAAPVVPERVVKPKSVVKAVPAPVAKPVPARVVKAKPAPASADQVQAFYQQRAEQEITAENMEAELKKIEQQINKEISSGL